MLQRSRSRHSSRGCPDGRAAIVPERGLTALAARRRTRGAAARIAEGGDVAGLSGIADGRATAVADRGLLRQGCVRCGGENGDGSCEGEKRFHFFFSLADWSFPPLSLRARPRTCYSAPNICCG